MELFEPELVPAGQKRGACTEHDRGDVHDHLVEQARIRELAREVAAADDPYVLPSSGLNHLGVYVRDFGARERDRRAGHRCRLTVREHPSRDLVRPAPLLARLFRELVLEDPLIGGRPHCESADAGDEVRVVERPFAILIAREQPVERVVLVGDEPVQARRRVVLRETHRFASLSSQVPCSSHWDLSSAYSTSPFSSPSILSGQGAWNVRT